jgi:hypothetical protein
MTKVHAHRAVHPGARSSGLPAGWVEADAFLASPDGQEIARLWPALTQVGAAGLILELARLIAGQAAHRRAEDARSEGEEVAISDRQILVDEP